MRAFIRLLLATLFMLPFFATPQEARAQTVEVSFSYFHDQLAPYGEWRNSPRWGDVWVPNVDSDFRPYSSAGRWEETTENGTVWVSDYEWGEIPFHYGRWVWDPDWRWVWVPGYVWGPGWVVWRSGSGNVGWFPMPPGDYEGDGVYGDDWNDYYGYRGWYGPDFDEDMFFSFWMFVPARYLFVNQINIYFIDYHHYHDFWGYTENWTHYTVVNNIVVNISINIHEHPRMFGDVRVVPTRTLFHRPMTTFNQGRAMRMREARHFGAAQRANFKANFRNDFNRGKARQDLFERTRGAGAAGLGRGGKGPGGAVTGAGRGAGGALGTQRGGKGPGGAVTGTGRGAGGTLGTQRGGRGPGGAVTGTGRGAGGTMGTQRGGKGPGGAVTGTGRGAGGAMGTQRGGKGPSGAVTGTSRGAGGAMGTQRGGKGPGGAVTGTGRGTGGTMGTQRGGKGPSGAVTGTGRGAGSVTGARRGQEGAGTTQQRRGQQGQGATQTQGKKKKCVGPNCPQ